MIFILLYIFINLSILYIYIFILSIVFFLYILYLSDYFYIFICYIFYSSSSSIFTSVKYGMMFFKWMFLSATSPVIGSQTV